MADLILVIRDVRRATGCSVASARAAVEANGGDFTLAVESIERVDRALAAAGPELVAKADKALRDHEERRRLMGVSRG